MLKAVKINMEYLEQPVGLGGIPWFGWILESDRKNVVQKSYQLQIADDLRFERILYDSGVVESEESVHVEVPWERTEGQGIRIGEKGKAWREIQSCREYFVRVRVSDGVEESPYSDTASFVTGILDRSE